MLGQLYPSVDWEPVLATALYNAAYTFDPTKGTFFTWLKSNIRCELSNGKRRHRHLLEVLGSRVLIEDQDVPQILHETVTLKYLPAWLNGAIGKLDEPLRCVVLAKLNGESTPSIATRLGRTKSAISARYRKAIELLGGKSTPLTGGSQPGEQEGPS